MAEDKPKLEIVKEPPPYIQGVILLELKSGKGITVMPVNPDVNGDVERLPTQDDIIKMISTVSKQIDAGIIATAIFNKMKEDALNQKVSNAVRGKLQH